MTYNIFALNCATVEVTISVQNHEDIRLKENITCTAGHIKASLYRALERESGEDELRLLYRGRELEEKDTILDIEPSIVETKKIAIYAVRPVPKSEAYKKVNNVRLLHRNVAECAKCAQDDVEPRERTRFNDPEVPTPPVPNALYVADMLVDIGQTYAVMAENLKKMSKVLKSSEIFEGEEYQRRRRLIQNNMDCVRYTNPMLLNMAKLRIPITEPRAAVQTMETCVPS
jgi:Zn finger protein HypA/HybF involved in hydrogenase expression